MDEKTQKDSWRTPPEVFDPLNAKFRFRFDMAASDVNALCRRYFTAEDSALGRQWPSAWKWCNPPYSQPLPWVEHAAQYRRTVMLLNQDTTTAWARLARRTANMIILLDWRIRFVHAVTGERGNSNNKCQQIYIFDEAPLAREAEVKIFSLSDLQEFCQ